jgi:Protein of unknown function (DUF2846)
MRNYTRAFLLGILVILLPGCASTKQSVRIPNLSVPVEDATKARIYVIRPALIGGAVQMKVTDNDELIGKTGPQSYLVWERSPGEAFVTSKAEKPCSVTLNVEAGKVYYVLQRVEPGVLYARCRMEQIDDEHAQKFLKGCKLAQQGY